MYCVLQYATQLSKSKCFASEQTKKSPLNSDKTVKWAEFVVLNYE